MNPIEIVELQSKPKAIASAKPDKYKHGPEAVKSAGATDLHMPVALRAQKQQGNAIGDIETGGLRRTWGTASAAALQPQTATEYCRSKRPA